MSDAGSAVVIRGEDISQSVADALQYISYYHPGDYIRNLAAAYEREESPAAKDAIAQILVNSRMAALGKRPLCQDTGLVVVFVKLGMNVRIDAAGLLQDKDRPSPQPSPSEGRGGCRAAASLADLVNEGVRRAYTDPDNPLRASIVRDPLFTRKNTGDNTPAVIHAEVVPGDTLRITVAAKGGGSENKARFTILNPHQSVVEWVLQTVPTLGAGWCPPGLMALGVGGSAEKAMLLAKEALLRPIDMPDLLARGPATDEEKLRIELYRKVNALGIGAQGLGGLTAILDFKVATYPTHAASLPVALIPQCAADRHATVVLDGSGPVRLDPPNLADWPEISLGEAAETAQRVNLDTLTREEVARWKPGLTLLLSGKMLTGRDAAHQRIATMLAKNQALPVQLAGRVIYYVGPVPAVRGEAVGPAGPTTATRMDSFTDLMLDQGLLAMVGKAERGPQAIASIARHGAAYLIAIGGAAYLVAGAIKASRLVAFGDLGMEAIHEFTVQDMPVTVAVDATGRSIHTEGPAQWRLRIAQREAESGQELSPIK